MNYIISFILFLIIAGTLYNFIGVQDILDRYKLFLLKSYWTDYNIIEACAWWAKGAIIIPGLIFGIEIWQLHTLTLITSSMLIWASMKKSLPTLIAFNTMWILLSLIVITRNIF
tara:strand:+ start:31 stop:372 length:342 start_codon:yes stop_codon:yes gene_type:complete